MIVIPVFKKSILPLFLSRGIRFRAAFLIAIVPVIIALFPPGKTVSSEPRSKPMFPLATCLLGAVIPFSRSLNKRDQTKESAGHEKPEISESLNEKNAQLSLQRSNRLASLGALTAGLAHEIRNPLVSVHTFLQLLPERYEDHDFRTQFHSLACDEMNRVNALLDELLSFSRPSEPNLRPGDLNGTVEKMLMLIGAEARKRGIEIVRDLAVDMPEIIMDREQVKQVLMNLLLNALQAMPTGGIMTVRSRFVTDGAPEFETEVAGADFVMLEVRDTGMGIPPRDMENLFKPFFTTKEEGTGLGLSIAYQIIREHGGCIDVESQPGNGAAFIVTLPVNTLSSGCREQDSL